MDGQIDMLSYLKSLEPGTEPPVLLKEGQEVFLVVKGDVIPYTVLSETWTYDGERGYRLQKKSGIYNCTWNKSIGLTCFKNYEPAHEAAEAYLKGKDIIMAENIKPIKTVAYSYIRKCDNREMIAFYSELDNGMVYIKEFMTYHHIVEAGKKGKAIKQFMDQQEFKYNDVKQIEYEPVFKNMYRIRQKYDWDYVEAEHSYAVG